MKSKFNIGDEVKVVTSSEEIFGKFLDDKKNLIIKLNNGYNLSLEKSKVKKIEVVKKVKKSENKVEKVKLNNKLKTIVILHTGGTFASKVDYSTGGTSAQFKPEELLKMFPEVKRLANVKSRLVRNMFSEDMNFMHYNLIAKEIAKEKCDGVIITHGTDTLHYTAAALRFIFEALDKPVILVGAQRSSDRGSSDAFLNLSLAVKFLAETEFNDIAICMHENMNDENCLIMPALKTRKLHTSRRDAFKVINGKAYARVGKNIEILDNSFNKVKEKCSLKLFKDVNVGTLKWHPNMKALEVRNYSKFDGLVLEGTGLGHFSINKIDKETLENEKIYLELKKLSKKIPIVVSSQCIFGRVNLNVYGTGRKMQEIGVLGNYSDMTTETSFIKLSWLLSNYKKDEVREMFMKNLRGEISKRVNEEFEF